MTKHVYVCGCAVNGGVYHYTSENGTLTFQDKLEVDRPMYMVIDGQKAYIIQREIDTASRFGGIIECEIAEDGSLIHPTAASNTLGIVPCHIAVREGDVYATNYLSGSIIRLPDTVRVHNGHGPHPDRQEAAHTHFVMISPDGNDVLCTDLGRDIIAVYDRELNLQHEIAMPAGVGPRHLALSEGEETLLCVNELSCSVSRLKRQDGRWTCIQTVDLLHEVTEQDTAAAIRIQGDIIYASVRGADLVARLCLDSEGLHFSDLTPCGGQSPRDIYLFDGQLFCANEISGTVTRLAIGDHGLAEAVVAANVPGALCVCGIDL